MPTDAIDSDSILIATIPRLLSAADAIVLAAAATIAWAIHLSLTVRSQNPFSSRNALVAGTR
ncbi:hypothetical protein MINTM020_01420 [Mycobacterium paraintracellulare]|nr:hypothetical protein MINTM020_01420 [Mycobacterium paraintracellulare]